MLAHLFPEADVPVVQLSINALEPLEYHLDIGQRLAPLCDRGILVLASGNIVHNLRRIAWDRPEEGDDWAHRFDDATREVLTRAPADILELVEHPDFAMAVPTPDHFIPLLYLAGLVAASGRAAHPFIDGCVYGSLSMTSYATDGPIGGAAASDAPPPPPLASDVPADQTNI